MTALGSAGAVLRRLCRAASLVLAIVISFFVRPAKAEAPRLCRECGGRLEREQPAPRPGCLGGPGRSFWEFISGSPLRSVRVDFRPRRIILLRHGESEGNVDESAYVTTADWRIPLTALGRRQASEAGRRIREKIGEDGRVFFYYSPYVRTRQTLEEVRRHIDAGRIVSAREEPRISEQQFGNFQNVEQVRRAKAERSRFGRFYYRYPSGEAGLDVYSRVSSFITTLVRDCHQYSHAGYDLDKMNVVIVTHGLAMRLFLMRWFQFSVEEFETSSNPENAKPVTMCKKYGEGDHKWFELNEEDRQSLSLPKCCGVPKNVQLHELRGVNG